MASLAELVAAMTAIGLLQRGLTDAAETSRADGEELHRLQMAHALAGAAEMQVLMAAGAAADAGADPAKITRAPVFAYTGANCDSDDDTKFTLVRVQAQRLASQMMVMAADVRAGRAELPLMVYPATLVATALQNLLDATGIDDAATRPERCARPPAHSRAPRESSPRWRPGPRYPPAPMAHRPRSSRTVPAAWFRE